MPCSATSSTTRASRSSRAAIGTNCTIWYSRRMHLEHRLEIDTPASVVWDLTVDVERWPETTPTMTSVERLDDGPLGVGSQARIKQPAQRPTVWTVTRFEPGRHFAWATKT